MIWLLLLILVTLFAINTQVAFALAITATAGVLMSSGIPLSIIPQRLIAGVNSFVLLAVPFFLLTGIVMNKGGITQRIFDFAKDLVGHVQGGLGHANIIAGIIMAGMSGSNQADAAGLSQVAVEGMVKEGYDKAFSAAVVAGAATIGPVIPPSIVLVIYGVLASVSVGALLIGGVIPGLVMGFTMMVAVYFISKKRKYPTTKRASLSQIFKSFRKAIWAILAPIILISGMFGGTFTPTEAGAVAALYSIFITAFVYKELKWKDIPLMFVELAVVTAGIMIILGASAPLGYVIAYEGIPQALAEGVLNITQTKWVVLSLINIILLILGMFLDSLAILSIMVPVLVPLAAAMNVDLVHFGVMFILNLMIGALTPPLGVVTYIVISVTKVPFIDLLRELLPFIIALFVSLLLITYIPDLVLFLPKVFLN